MIQLKLNNDFTEMIMDIPRWQNAEDIPSHIKEFIINTSNKRVIYETKTGYTYCGKCVSKLNKNDYCECCHIQHKKYSSDEIGLSYHKDITKVYKINDYELYNLDTICRYYVFDIVDKDVWLYYIEEEVSYSNNAYFLIPNKKSYLEVILEKSYFVGKNGIINLKTNKEYTFSYIDKIKNNLYNGIDISDEEFQIVEELVLDWDFAYLYPNNLNDLNNTVYKYSKISELLCHLDNNTTFNIAKLTINPIYYPAFEYLVNYKLYKLAWEDSDKFQSCNNFKEIFGVDKKYLPFMAENDINYDELLVLQVYPTFDIDILKYYSGFFPNTEFLNGLDLRKLKDYLEKKSLSSHYVSDYLDYINMAKEVGLDLKDKKVLYPNNLREAHNDLYNQIEVIADPLIDEKIANIAKSLSINKYEDDKYVIFPASSIAEFIEESKQQKNCVRTYCARVANNECHVYFMRKKKNINKSFVTIEVCNNKVIQARVKYNELPKEDVKNIIENWEKSLIPVVTG